MKCARPTGAVVAALAVYLSAASHLHAGPVVVDAGGTVAGKTISQWTADWWNWAVTEPTGKDPFTDTTGAKPSPIVDL